jgi:hypothetical protein
VPDLTPVPAYLLPPAFPVPRAGVRPSPAAVAHALRVRDEVAKREPQGELYWTEPLAHRRPSIDHLYALSASNTDQSNMLFDRNRTSPILVPSEIGNLSPLVSSSFPEIGPEATLEILIVDEREVMATVGKDHDIVNEILVEGPSAPET